MKSKPEGIGYGDVPYGAGSLLPVDVVRLDLLLLLEYGPRLFGCCPKGIIPALRDPPTAADRQLAGGLCRRLVGVGNTELTLISPST